MSCARSEGDESIGTFAADVSLSGEVREESEDSLTGFFKC
jgi:hypothetical protein